MTHLSEQISLQQSGASPNRLTLQSATQQSATNSALVEEGGEFVAGSEEKDDADDEAVGSGEGRDERLDAWAVGAGGEDAGGAGGHEGVHEKEAEDEAEEPEEAAAGASEIGGQEEEEEL